jgi:hypothetical protein
MRTTETRLRRLEAAAMPKSRYVVVIDYSDAEHEAKIAALKASGDARDGDFIICVRKFAKPGGTEGIQA